MKVENIKLKIYCLLFGILSYLLVVQTISAAPLSLSVDPPITVINAIPPTTATSPINIQNSGDTQINLQIQIKPFKAKGENGEISYPNEALEILKNIQILDDNLPIEDITLGPKQEKNLMLSIDIPKDSNISDYYFSVIFISTNVPMTESSISVNQVGIATNVLLSVGALEIPEASLEKFSSKIFLEEGPVSFTVRIKNSGTHLIQPKGQIAIKNMFNQNVGKLDLFSTNVLSDSIRTIPEENTLWKENFLLGIYSATLNISMSDEGPVFTKTIHFFAFPFKILIIILLVVIVIIVVNNKLKIYANKDRMQV